MGDLLRYLGTTGAFIIFCVGCASKTPYALLSEKVYSQTDVPRRYKLQPLPAPYPYLAIGDVIAPTEAPIQQGDKIRYVDSFDVVTSPLTTVYKYINPDLPDISKCLINNVENELGDIGKEQITVILDAKTLASLGGGYRNAALEIGAKSLRENAQALKLEIPLRYLRPANVDFDQMLKQVQLASYEPLKRGCSGHVNDGNFVQLREKIQNNMKLAQSSHGSAEKLYIIDAIVWSDSLSAKLVDIHSSEVTANAKLDLAALATGAIGVPNAEVRYVDAENQTVSIDAARTHWAYRSLPLKLDPANGLLEVDRSAPQLLLSPTYRKAAKMVVSR